MYKVELTSRAQRELNAIPRQGAPAIDRALRVLRENPRPPGTVKLSDITYRIRVGQWRTIYQIYDGERMVLVGKITRRSESTYRGIRDLF